MTVQESGRIRLIAMPKEPFPIEPGTEGSKTDVKPITCAGGSFAQISVDWDTNRNLMLSVPPDRFVAIPKEG